MTNIRRVAFGMEKREMAEAGEEVELVRGFETAQRFPALANRGSGRLQKLSLFGSYARGIALRSVSDVDVLADFDRSSA